MPEEKRKVGSPRKYDTQAERQKAYHNRKRERVKKLEEQLEKLEKQVLFSSDQSSYLEKISFKEVPKFKWKKITPSEIALMGTQELELFINEFREHINEFTLNTSLENIIMGIIRKNYLESQDFSKNEIERLNYHIKTNITLFESRIQQQTLIYLMEAELENRLRLNNRKSKLDIFESKVEALEKNIQKKKLEVKNKELQ